MLDLEHGSQLLRLIGEPTRLRLLLILEAEPLTVAELTAVTGLSQSRVSTHLGRLRRGGLVKEYGQRTRALLTVDPASFDDRARQLWQVLAENIDDARLHQDREQAREIARRRQVRPSWAESAAGSMERQYSPGRTWEATTRALIGLLTLGDVLDVASGDGVLAELLGNQARSVTCFDYSRTVLAAARRRLAQRRNVHFELGDMHALTMADASYDQVFVMHALTFTDQPGRVIAEAARVLRPGGDLVLATLAEHEHGATVAAYDHVNLGFSRAALLDWTAEAGLDVRYCELSSREARPPYFEVLTLIATKPA
ncbi:MAG: methyltransferase domain-containing protein [Salinisphaeraceae bacterium]